MFPTLASIESAAIAASTGIAGYVWFWLLLLSFALLELIAPGRQSNIDQQARIQVNFALGLCNAVIVLVPFLSEITLAELVRREGWGLLNARSVPGWAAFAGGILLFDLGYYLRHRIEHGWPLLWRLHRVHHSDAAMDLSTTFRTHPIDVLVGIAFNLAIIALFGVPPAAVALHGLVRQLVMAWGHANLAPFPRLSRAAGWLIVTPAFHARHHSAAHMETDSNFAIVLTLWDRLFRTISRGTKPVARFGLGDGYDSGASRITAQLRLPFDPV